MYYTDSDAEMLARVAFCESRGINSETEIACVMWTVLNRVDNGNYGASIADVITAPNQFAYNPNAGTVSDFGVDLVVLAYDVLDSWNNEKNGVTSAGRVLPPDYYWYSGNGKHNFFRNSFASGYVWDYSLPSPYNT